MTYFGAAILTLFLLGLTSAGWYCLFKRFERRMSDRFDDLVQRSEENLKSFADVFYNLDCASADLAERIQGVKLNAEETLHELEMADRKLDILQGLALVIKQDRFMEHVRAMGEAYRKNGKIDEKTISRLEKMLNEMKLDNFSRH